MNIFGGKDYWNYENIPAEVTPAEATPAGDSELSSDKDSHTDVEHELTDPMEHQPSMRKFLGDGMLYVWEDNEERILSDTEFKIEFINRLWNLQLNFSKINKRLQETIPIGDLPSTVKFGIAQGTIYKLIENDNTIDFIGPCINLASRLVKYCPEINFIASARLDLPKDELSKYGYFRIIAKELRSFENEIVIIDRDDYTNVETVDQARLFEEL